MARLVMLLAGAAFALVFAAEARAAEIRVLTAGAMRAVIGTMVPDFEKATGHKIVMANDTAGGVAKRITDGEAFDLAVTTPRFIDELMGQGKLAAGSRTDLAKVGMGVAIKEGAVKPDIGTVDAFKRTLVAAKSVGYVDPKSGATSGIYFDKLLERLGIADVVRPKARLRSGGYVAEWVASGEVEIAVHQISEIVPVKGVTLAGPLPAEVQLYTVYSAGLVAAAKEPAAARALLAHLSGVGAAPVLEAKGMTKP
jgi:molybdate transport system substrate-binding protein